MSKTKIKVVTMLFIIGLSLTTFPVLGVSINKSKRKLMAGACSMSITPTETTVWGTPAYPDGSPVFLAGFGGFGERMASSIHDNIYARCLVLNYDGTTIAFVTLDLIGYFIDQVKLIENEVDADYVIIASTHTHSGPDTLGLWNGPPGVNWPYMDYVRERIVECINEASQDMHKARIRFASTTVPGLMRNTRDQDPQYAVTYPDLEVMKVEDRRGETIATMINYAGHPEVLWSDNLELTSDYVGYLCDEVEEELGGVAIFINGAIGGMVTPDSDGVFDGKYTPGVPSQHTFEMAETIGTILAEETINALADAKKSPPKMEFNVERKTLTVPLENMGFYFLMIMGILERPEPWYSPSIPLFGSIMTEVNVINIGEAQMITMPGEVLPSIGHRLKEVMTGKYNFQIGMGNDELGYIIPKEEWDYSGYWTMTPYGPVWEGKYEESMAIGDDIGEVMENTLLEMLNGT